jgi:CelD/BcsL family acetyltransferase involved in cellulose biosynthesis
MHIDVVPPSALAGLAQEWASLWSTVPDGTPFQSPAWILPWSEVYAPGRCWAAVLRSDGRLAGVLPMFAWDGALLLAGSGPSDRSSALLAEGTAAHAPDLLAAIVRAVPEPFNRIDLQQLDLDGPLAAAPPPAGWHARRMPGEPWHVLPLAGGDGMENVPRRMRANWAYAARRLHREGGEISRVGAAAGRTAERLASLHGARWRAKGESGVLSDALLATFLGRAIPALDDAGLLRAYELAAAGETVGVLFAMRGASSTSYYLSGFDPAHARLSPGTVLVGRAIEDAAAEGAIAFDFLRGNEGYKHRWGTVERPSIRRVFERVSA